MLELEDILKNDDFDKFVEKFNEFSHLILNNDDKVEDYIFPLNNFKKISEYLVEKYRVINKYRLLKFFEKNKEFVAKALKNHNYDYSQTPIKNENLRQLLDENNIKYKKVNKRVKKTSNNKKVKFTNQQIKKYIDGYSYDKLCEVIDEGLADKFKNDIINSLSYNIKKNNKRNVYYKPLNFFFRKGKIEYFIKVLKYVEIQKLNEKIALNFLKYREFIVFQKLLEEKFFDPIDTSNEKDFPSVYNLDKNEVLLLISYFPLAITNPDVIAFCKLMRYDIDGLDYSLPKEKNYVNVFRRNSYYYYRTCKNKNIDNEYLNLMKNSISDWPIRIFLSYNDQNALKYIGDNNIKLSYEIYKKILNKNVRSFGLVCANKEKINGTKFMEHILCPNNNYYYRTNNVKLQSVKYIIKNFNYKFQMKHLYYVLDNKNVRDFFIDYYKLDCLILDYNKMKESIEIDINRILAELFINDYDFFKKIKNINIQKDLLKHLSSKLGMCYDDKYQLFEIIDRLFNLFDKNREDIVNAIVYFYRYNFNTFKYFIEKYNITFDKDLIFEFNLNENVINYFVEKANLNLEEFMLDPKHESYIKIQILLCYPFEKEKMEMYYVEISKLQGHGFEYLYNEEYLELAKKMGFIIKPCYDLCKVYIDGYLKEKEELNKNKKSGKKNKKVRGSRIYFKSGYDIIRELIKLEVRNCD